MSDRYQKSEALLAQAKQVIPLASQTFSKSYTQYPYGVSPYFIQRGEGCYVWDVDGNRYIDFVNGLAAITLGYDDADVKQAVSQQLQQGITFSLPHPIELAVAEKIIELVPCAEMLRFGKNGSDATSGAIRLARAYTQREHIVTCGYHGWHDWYIATTSKNAGVPQAVRELTHSFQYNDIASLRQLFHAYPEKIAAVIMEPMNSTYPQAEFLQQVKQLTHQHGALLIFDETITGFRYALGGAQELFAVTPDLATFGKGLANGFPLSALCGRKSIMQMMEEIFYSFTFGGETLSLAAANAVLAKLTQYPVLNHIAAMGKLLQEKLENLISQYALQETFSVCGHPSWLFLQIHADSAQSTQLIKTYLMQELLARGFLWIGTFNLSYAHQPEHIDQLIGALSEIFCTMQKTCQSELQQYLHCEVLTPLFKVR
jgi:glutamate-1-semialdehyde 2,1-aminomutase